MSNETPNLFGTQKLQLQSTVSKRVIDDTYYKTHCLLHLTILPNENSSNLIQTIHTCMKTNKLLGTYDLRGFKLPQCIA